MQGIISSGTLRKCQELRRRGKKLVLISGMRLTTWWNRIPYLPRADAYCCEAGGRIFYSVKPGKGLSFKLEHFDGASASGLEAFGLEEDTEWRSKIEATAGVGGFAGNELDGNSSASVVTIGQRKGRLWDYCLELQEKGFVIDTKGYSVCFRVNRKQQKLVSEDQFEALKSIAPPEGLSTSVNLGCVDFYPFDSGKKNWYVVILRGAFVLSSSAVCSRLESCQYVSRKLCNDEMVLGENAVCMCDDDNDLEMALACRYAFAPGISSESMAQVVKNNGNNIIATGGVDGLEEGTSATERALDAVLGMVI